MARDAEEKLADAGPAEGNGNLLDRRWHLGQTPHEIAIVELEYALFRIYESFGRWQRECLAAVSGQELSTSDNAVLHIIRLKDRPKAVTEVAQLLNRDDVANLQYSVRKLLAAGMIEKVTGNKRKGVQYRTTNKGREVTEMYAKLRQRALIALTEAVPGLEAHVDEATRTLNLMNGIYEQAAHVTRTHRQPMDD